MPVNELRLLSADVVKLWRVSLLLRTFAWAAAMAILGVVAARTRPGMLTVIAAAAAGAVGLGGLAAVLFWPPALYRSWGFSVRDDDVVIRRGVWHRRESIVPHARIQHVDTTRGPLERAFGLASVVLFTAGTVGAALVIPGLPAAEAAELRDRLAALGRLGDGV